jgi:putative phage-type endonuclease
MRHLELEQGTEAWLKARLERFTASEAAAMFGVHKNISRTQLLDHKKGWTTEVDSFTQSLFDKGHATEEMARPLAEQVAGEDFAAVVGELEDSMFLASFDGMSMLGDVLFEHKLYNKTLAENVRNDKLEPHYYWQLEHQLLVSGAEKILFVTSDGTKDNWADMYYVSVPGRREELLAGWAQFAKDLENHQPQAKTEKVVAEQSNDLPVISYKMDGLTLKSNLDVFKESATALVEKSKTVIETDQDFANAESRQKTFTKAEKDIDSLCDRVLGEVADIDAFVKDLRFIKDQIRTARLAEGKQVKERKEEIRVNIINAALVAVNECIAEAESEVKAKIPLVSISISDAMKGKKNIDSLQNAADTALAQCKVEIEGHAKVARLNIATINELAEGYKFLFNDWKDIAFKANDDFTFLVKTRIAEHKQIEADKAEALRAKIQREEETKAQAKVAAEKAEAERLERVKQGEIQEEQSRLEREKRENEEAESARLERFEKRASAPHKPTVVNDTQEADAIREKPQTTAFMQSPKSSTKQPVKILSYSPLGLWPSDQDRADNDTLNQICEQLEEAESYICFLESSINGVAAA